ncbi:MAG: hypothetical protein EHM36_04090, partial [Deltaproteobacteria bacterium]
EMRKKDFVTSLVLVVFGIWMVVYTVLSIPMKDSWGGVMNVWFVSPGLFPVCIGILTIIMGAVLMNRAIRDGGAKKFLEDLSARRKESTGKTLRLLGIVLVICSYVYLNIPRIDYFLSTLLCLMVFISFFYFDDQRVLKKLFVFYLAGSFFFLALFFTGLDGHLKEGFPYSVDVLGMFFFFAYVAYCWTLIQKDKGMRKKLRLTLIMSVIASLVLIPSFKYFLLVPLPVEGLFIEMMNIVRYALR